MLESNSVAKSTAYCNVSWAFSEVPIGTRIFFIGSVLIVFNAYTCLLVRHGAVKHLGYYQLKGSSLSLIGLFMNSINLQIKFNRP
jgi:hypothetical protein